MFRISHSDKIFERLGFGSWDLFDNDSIANFRHRVTTGTVRCTSKLNSDGSTTVRVELPGVKKADTELYLINRDTTLKIKYVLEDIAHTVNFLLDSEPVKVDSDTLEDGVLRVIYNRQDCPPERKIDIK